MHLFQILNTIISAIFQIKLTSFDLGIPKKFSSNSATVKIKVQRNDFTPEFVNKANLKKTIRADQAVGSNILDVDVRDRDSVVGSFRGKNTKKMKSFMP